MAHTPGPWFAHPIHVRDNYAASKPIFGDGLWHVRRSNDPETCPIAEIDRGDDHDEPTRKQAADDARLIAAAPDLLEALNNIIEFAQGYLDVGGMEHQDFLDCKVAIASADAAIRRATNPEEKG